MTGRALVRPQLLARAWVDGAFRKRLLDDGTQAIGELGFGGAEGEHLVVLENTPAVHNVVVCTLCSCYPWPVLGLPPRWYKSFAYRSRMVREPRAVLAEFGTTLDDDVEVRVWDSSADVRYLKGLGLKGVQHQVQGDQLRVSGKKRDDLQSAIQSLKDHDFGIPLQFTNFRD